MSNLIIGERRGRWRRALRRASIIVGGILLTLILTYTAFRRWTYLQPLDDEGPALPQSVRVEIQDEIVRQSVGKSWMERRDGIWRIFLNGDARTMGNAHGLLVGRMTAAIDEHMMHMMHKFVPNGFKQWLVGNVVRWRFRNMPDNIPEDHLLEVSAFSRVIVDAAEYTEEPFQRLIYYHALHDITQRLDGSPLIGCTAFAGWGKKSAGGNLIVGRNFDFEGGDIFDRQKALIVFKSPKRIPFVSVAWPGMMGVVTGVNAQKLYISINAARTDDGLEPGIPMGFLTREILEHASSIEEALAIIKKHKVMVAEAILIADGKVPEAAVIELSPQRVVVRRNVGETIGVANHFLDPTYKSDAKNDWLKRYTTSNARYLRLEELLKSLGTNKRLDFRIAAEFLRDRSAKNGEPLSLGNRNAIDALIATHSVVVDLSHMLLWISTGPHLLGKYIPIDLKPLLGLPATNVQILEPIPADNLKDSPRLERYRLMQAYLAHANALWKNGEEHAAIDYAKRAAELMPLSPETHKVLGNFLWQEDHREEAKQQYQLFLKLNPPYLRDKEIVKLRLTQ